MKVAYFSPLPPERSGIADYSALLLPALEKRLDVKAVRRGAKKAPRGTDIALYHVGNNPEAHGWIVDALRRRPGLVVLHDFVLHHLVAGITLGRGDPEGYLDAMQRDGGVVGRLLAHGVVDQLLPPIWEERAEDFPLAWPVLDHADGVICHSRYVERLVREYGYERPVHVIPMPAWPSVELGVAGRSGGPFPGLRLLRLSERRQAGPAAAGGVRARPAPLPERTARPGRGRDAGSGARRREPRRRRAPARPSGGGPALASARGLRRERQPPLADDGRDVWDGDPRALAWKTARRQ